MHIEAKTDNPLAGPGAKMLAEGVVLHPDRTLSLQFRYRNRPQPWERRHVVEWAAQLALDPPLQLAEMIRRLKDPKGCWPAAYLLADAAKASMYVLKRDGAVVDGVHYTFDALLEHLGLTEPALSHRLRNGWALEQAVSTKSALAPLRDQRVQADAKIDPASDKRARLFEYDGVWASLKGHCERLGLNYHTVLSRIQGRRYRVKAADGSMVVQRRSPAMPVYAALRAGRRKTRSDKGGKHNYKASIAKRLDFGA